MLGLELFEEGKGGEQEIARLRQRQSFVDRTLESIGFTPGNSCAVIVNGELRIHILVKPDTNRKIHVLDSWNQFPDKAHICVVTNNDAVTQSLRPCFSNEIEVETEEVPTFPI